VFDLSPSCCGLATTWSSCCDDYPGSNLGGHAPLLCGVCQMWLVIVGPVLLIGYSLWA